MKNIRSKTSTITSRMWTLLIFVITLVGCDKKTDEIKGNWVWVESVHGWTGTTTPESTGDNMELIIDQSEIKFYKNNDLISISEYSSDEHSSDVCSSNYILIGTMWNSCIEIESDLMTITPFGVTDQGFSKWKRK